MKIDRRSFLGLGLGAAAGVAVSPATWKLTDDSSIWTQNWPWTPVPRDGEVSFDNTVCSLCSGHCGISVRKIDGRPVKIEGREDYPVNQGGVCLHGISGLQYLYDPARVKNPMIKKEGTWQKASWEEAVTLVASKLGDLRAEDKSDSIACIAGKDNGTVPELFKRLLMATGSQNFFSMETMEKTWELTVSKLHGINASPGFDLENSDYILSFGCGFIEGWGSPVSNFKVNGLRKKNKGTFVQVECRLSNTAASADMWLPAKPGTEADLALGICSVIVSEKLYDADFVKNFVRGFDAFTKMLEESYSPEAVALTTGVDMAKIKTVARAFAKAGAPIAIAGKGKGLSAGSSKEFAAVHALNCLAGNINKKGGVWTISKVDKLQWPALEMDSVATRGYAKAPMDDSNSVAGLLSKVNTSKAPVVNALMVYEANPCFALHDAKAVQEAFKKIPFVVSFSSYMDDTAELADVILPSHIYLERYEDVCGSTGMVKTITGLSKPIVKPLFDTKHPADAVIMIARAMEGAIAKSFPWEGYEACIEGVSGEMWSTLNEDGFHTGSEDTPANKPPVDFSFLAQNIPSIVAEGDEKAFPLTLVPIDNVRLIGGALAPSPFAVKTVSDNVLKGNRGFVELNPETADEIGVSHGDEVAIATPRSSAVVRVNVNEGIMPGVAAIAAGLGHSAGENGYVDGKGVNVNELMGQVMDAASGLDAAWGIRAKISRA